MKPFRGKNVPTLKLTVNATFYLPTILSATGISRDMVDTYPGVKVSNHENILCVVVVAVVHDDSL